MSSGRLARIATVFERVERELSVTDIAPELRNANNEVLRRGCETLGWRGGPLRHNRIGCQESGFCELGCAYNAKQNGVKVLVPDALDAGARVYTDTQVVRLVLDGTRVVGVEARALDRAATPGIFRCVAASSSWPRAP